jgi:hypothetical protein
MNITFSREYQLQDDDWFEVCFCVCVKVDKGRPGVDHLPNGDPGYPGEGDEVEIDDDVFEWSTDNKVNIILTKKEIERIEEDAIEKAYDMEEYDEYE